MVLKVIIKILQDKMIKLIKILLFILYAPLFCEDKVVISSPSVSSGMKESEFLQIESQVFTFLKNENPILYEKFLKLKKSFPEFYPTVIISEKEKIEKIKKLTSEHKKIIDEFDKRLQLLEKKAKEISQLYNLESEPQRKIELKIELKNVITEIFDLKQKKYEAAIDSFGKKIEELKIKVKKREAVKDKIIDKYLEDIIVKQEIIEE